MWQLLSKLKNALHITRELIGALVLFFLIKKSMRLGLFPEPLPPLDPEEAKIPPLLEAIKQEDIEAVRVLLAEGADPNSFVYSLSYKDDSLRWTALFEAVITGSLEMVCLLVETGADINYCSSRDGTALVLAATGCFPIVQYLVEQGADVNLFGTYGDPVLIEPVDDGDIEIVDYLIEHGVDVNATNQSQGATALMFAAQSLELPLIKRLVEAGAKTSMRDSRGHDAIWYARTEAKGGTLQEKQACKEIVSYLKQHNSR